ncbi:hypothetical protein [Rickettsia endosymbiont of Orchestes rusci]|uniref:hypothetical protein n=1 Tax=Rickettsia endosymbiont of Orchestes rusci TaxID=3066250 RepID=UPI00313CE0CA
MTQFPRLPRRDYVPPRNDGVFYNDFEPGNKTAAPRNDNTLSFLLFQLLPIRRY